MKKIVFIIPFISDSHYKNRILEFIENGYDVEVFGFDRNDRKLSNQLPYNYVILGKLRSRGYLERVKIYLKSFIGFSKKYHGENVCYFFGGLDIALFFLLLNPYVLYIYEECDLMHTYTKIKRILEILDKIVIKKSLVTISSSEGFNQYHFGKDVPSNICLITNRLNKDVLRYPVPKYRLPNSNNLQIGFVGIPRPQTYFLIDTICKNFPQHSFHLYGGPLPEEFEKLKMYSNFHDHGVFKNPSDLPNIYSSIDILLCTYDNRYDNPKYAEPNKLYEAIYFETPIVVSSNTFLSDKVHMLNIGYALNPFDESEIIHFFKSIDVNDLREKHFSCAQVDKKKLININTYFFNIIASKLR